MEDHLTKPAETEGDDIESFHRRYVATCQRLGVTPVSHTRARELVAVWDAMFAYAVEKPTLQ